MNEDLEQLKALGVQKVHEDTHISRKNIEGIFNQSFDGMNPVQFAGFVSILEREYGLELAGLKRSFLAYWEERYGTEEEEFYEEPRKKPRKKRGGKGMMFLAAAVVAGVLFYLAGDSAEPQSEPAVTETAVVVETPEVSEDVLEASSAQTPAQEAIVEAEAELETAEADVPAVKSLSIVPKTQLWMGFIDLENYKREQELTSHPVAVDTNRSWLMIFGHGHFKVEQGEETLDFNSDNRLRFIYENGTLREITRMEFKERNRGQNW